MSCWSYPTSIQSLQTRFRETRDKMILTKCAGTKTSPNQQKSFFRLQKKNMPFFPTPSSLPWRISKSFEDFFSKNLLSLSLSLCFLVKSPDRHPICCFFFPEALSAAWSKLKSSERKPFEAQAMIDRCRKEIQDLRGAKLKETAKFACKSRGRPVFSVRICQFFLKYSNKDRVGWRWGWMGEWLDMEKCSKSAWLCVDLRYFEIGKIG